MIEKTSTQIIVNLPSSICFYEEKASSAIEELSLLAEQLHKTPPKSTTGVMLIQSQNANDWQANWILELDKKTMFTALVSRIATWRWLLSLIRNSPIPWAFASSSDCLSSSWELALCCQRRYWFKPGAQLGFPEIKAGVFPPGGILESLTKRTGRTKERWQSKPVYSASEALDDGLIDFCSQSYEWRDRSLAIFREMLSLNPISGVRQSRRERPREDFISVDSQSRGTAYEQIESAWHHEKFGAVKGPTAWDYCWQLVNERSKLKRPEDLGRLISIISSRYLLLPAYNLWLRSKFAQHLARPEATDALTCLSPIMIDVRHGSPPSSVVERLLLNSVQIVFMSDEGRDLVNCLNRQFNQLERTLGNVAAQNLWERYVNWFVGTKNTINQPFLAWGNDDTVTFTIGDINQSFLRLEGNGPDADPGLMEAIKLNYESSEIINTLVNFVSDGLTTAPVQVDSPPLAVKIRSLFLDEMLRMTQYADGDLVALVISLQHSGWRFAGNEESWDRFLRTRSAFPVRISEANEVGVLQSYNGEITSWRSAKVHAKRSRSNLLPKWSDTAMSHHFAIFLGLLTVSAAKNLDLTARIGTDHLISMALGLPSSSGTPLTFLKLRGRRRIEHYAARYWPHLSKIGNFDDLLQI